MQFNLVGQSLGDLQEIPRVLGEDSGVRLQIARFLGCLRLPLIALFIRLNVGG